MEDTTEMIGRCPWSYLDELIARLLVGFTLFIFLEVLPPLFDNMTRSMFSYSILVDTYRCLFGLSKDFFRVALKSFIFPTYPFLVARDKYS